jgi:23S rRNA pseudouridine2605 synthase
MAIMTQERLQKILARAGVASRRAAEQLITGGRVRVNGKPVVELGARADIETDRIEVDGRTIGREEPVYYLLHKPRGMVTTLSDPEDRPSLAELLDQIPERVYPVGRLDFHTSGALLLTNDGDLAQALLHPSRAVPKTYVVKLNREVDPSMLRELERGVTLDDGYRTQPARVEHLRDDEGKSWLQITITEGKNRQIHRMIEAVGPRVMRLSRLSFAGLSTDDLRPGAFRELTQSELSTLRRDYLTQAKPARAEGRAPEREKARTPEREGRAPSRTEGRRPERSEATTSTRGGAHAGARVTPAKHAGASRVSTGTTRRDAEKSGARVDRPKGPGHKSRPT